MSDKKEKLKAIIEGYGSLAIAFSGGVDSALLAAFAAPLLPDNLLLLNARSPSFPEDEAEFVQSFARTLNVPLRIIDTRELEIEEYAENQPSRCYFCRTEMYSKLWPLAEAAGMAFLADGANTDDRSDYRPGMRAASEWRIQHPLQDAEFSKADIRQLSRDMDLPTWDKPAFACLASRIPYGEKIDSAKLRRVADAEQVLRRNGFRIYRVRSHEDLARLEFGESEIERGFQMRAELTRELKALGYLYVTIDLQGYRTGSMNEALTQQFEK